MPRFLAARAGFCMFIECRFAFDCINLIADISARATQYGDVIRCEDTTIHFVTTGGYLRIECPGFKRQLRNLARDSSR